MTIMSSTSALTSATQIRDNRTNSQQHEGKGNKQEQPESSPEPVAPSICTSTATVLVQGRPQVVVDEIVTESDTNNASRETSSSSTTMKALLQKHIPGVLVDEEAGLAAMFQEIHQSLPDPSVGKDLARATLAQMLAAWASIKTSANCGSSEAARSVDVADRDTTPIVLLTGHIEEEEEDLSMTAMFRELRSSIPNGPEIDTAAHMDAALAKILHTVYETREGMNRTASQVSDIVSPSMTKSINQNEDISMTAMVQEVVNLFPIGIVSEKQVEDHLVKRMEQIMMENADDGLLLCEGQVVTAVASDSDACVALGPSDEQGSRAPYPESPRGRQAQHSKSNPLLQPSYLVPYLDMKGDPTQKTQPTTVDNRTKPGTKENPVDLISVQDRVAQIEQNIPVRPSATIMVDAPTKPNVKVDPMTISMEKSFQKAPTITIKEVTVVADVSKPTIAIKKEEEEKKEDPVEAGAVLPDFLHASLPDIVVDEEIGIAAMLREIQESMPNASGNNDIAREAMARLWTAWSSVHQPAVASFSAAKEDASTVIDKTVVDLPSDGDADISMAAMFREMRDSLPDGPEIHTKEYVDALLANMLSAYSKARDMAPSPPQVGSNTLPSRDDEDISMAGMFKELANHFVPGSEQQAETYMINRLERLLCLSDAAAAAAASTDVNESSSNGAVV